MMFPKALATLIVVVLLTQMSRNGIVANNADASLKNMNPIADIVLDGPTYVSILIGLHRYVYFFNEVRTHDDAEAFCNRVGGTLMTIDSRSKQNLFVRLIKRHRHWDSSLATHIIWIKARLDPSCGVYKDGNGKIFYQTDPIRTALGYSNWLPPTEPQVADGNCVQVNTMRKFKWWTLDCDDTGVVVCEMNGHCDRWFDNVFRCDQEETCGFTPLNDDQNSTIGACLDRAR